MFAPESYTIIVHYFPRLLGLIYFFALFSLLFQIKGLIGSNGILPLQNYLNLLKENFPDKKTLYRNFPSIFWINASDGTIFYSIIIGILLSIALIFGFYPSILLFLLYFLHLSIIIAGQDFLSFGWEGLLLEITIQTFLISLSDIPNPFIWFSINFLLFRFHFQAGLVKIQTRDVSWQNWSALSFHYETQPIPNMTAWYAHKLPFWFQKLTTALVLGIELIVPFGIFFNEQARFAVCIIFLGFQFMIWLTGNFSYLNYLTAAFSTLLISNAFLSPFIDTPIVKATPIWIEIPLSVIGFILIILQSLRLYHQFFPNNRLNKFLNWSHAFHITNRYTLFGSMTTDRFEVIVEGSKDGENWKEYSFKYKPSEITRRPRRISPLQPRLDWQFWFLPFHEFYNEEWYQKFLYHLLKGTPEVLSLLRINPFPDRPPRYIRSLLYHYKFSSFSEREEGHNWWNRKLIKIYSPIMILKKRTNDQKLSIF